MPFQPTIRPLKFDKFNAMPYSDWINDEWNNHISKCGIIDFEFCQKVLLEDNIGPIQFKPRFKGANKVPISQIFQGSAGTPTANEVNSTGIGANAEIGYLVRNVTTNEFAYVTSVAPDTLGLSGDIFPNAGETVIVYAISSTASQQWNGSIVGGFTYLCKSDYDATSSISFSTNYTTGSIYYVKVEVRNYSYGTLRVALGTNVIGTIDSNGTHEFYGQANGSNLVLSSVASSDFVGCVVLNSMESYEVVTGYLGVFYDAEMNIIFSGDINFANVAIASGTASRTLPSKYSDVLDGCSCMYWALFDGDCYINNLINSDFKGGCWAFTENVQDVGDSIGFGNAEVGDNATYACDMLCPIECGQEYTLTVTVTDYISGSIDILFANGIYNINANGTYVFRRTPSGICTDLDKFSITASGPDLTSLNVSVVNIRKTPVFEDAALISERVCACEPEECDIVIDYNNRLNVYGFPYEQLGDQFMNSIRFCGSISKHKLESNAYNIIKSAKGIMSTVFSDVDQTWTLETELMPPYLAQNIIVGLQHTTVHINGKNYVMRQVGQVTEQESTEMVQVVASMTPKDQTETFTYS